MGPQGSLGILFELIHGSFWLETKLKGFLFVNHLHDCVFLYDC